MVANANIDSKVTQKRLKEHNKFQDDLGEYASKHGVAAATKAMKVTRGRARYRLKRYEQRNILHGTHGGHKTGFSDEATAIISGTLQKILKSKPTLSIRMFCNEVFKETGYRVSPTYVKTVLALSDWTWKVSECKHVNKYHRANMEKYLQYLHWLYSKDPEKVKFLDECHFSPRDNQTRGGWAQRGVPLVITKPDLLEKARSITLVTSLNTDELIYWTWREASDTQEGDLHSLRELILAGVLRRGDSLVMDNARVHTGRRIPPELEDLLQREGIELYYLPTYSPELNPCEFVFARIKHFMRSPLARAYDPMTDKEVSRSFNELMVDATSRISEHSLRKTYRDCARVCPKSKVVERMVRLGLIDAPEDPVNP